MAGTVAVTREQLEYGKRGSAKRCEKVNFAIVADAADGSVPNTTVDLRGWLIKVVTNPGATAPTANYDITLGDPSDSALDVLAGALANRHTTATEQVYPMIAGTVGTVSSQPVFLCGSHTLAVANNSVNSAVISVDFYLVDEI